MPRRKPSASSRAVTRPTLSAPRTDLPQPASQEDRVSGQFQSVEAAHACPEQNRDAFDDAGGRDTRLPAPVCDTRDDGVGELEDLLGVGDQAAENGQPFLARKRFHSSSETSFTRRCSSWNSATAWRTGSCNALGIHIWRTLPAWLCTKYSDVCPAPSAQRQLGLPHLLERSDSVPRGNRSPEAICEMRERRPRSVAESSARLRRDAMSCR